MVILTPDGPGRVRMAFWNSDGSRAAMCGNAALCSARLAVYLELAAPGDLCLLTDAGLVRARCDGAGDRPRSTSRTSSCPAAVPGLEPEPGSAGWPSPRWACRTWSSGWTTSSGRSAGPRAVAPIRPAARAGGRQRQFRGAAVGAGEPWLIRTYERGVEGETLACGTGTVAAAVALAARGEARLPLRFRSRGGPELLVEPAWTASGLERLAGGPGPAAVPGRLGRNLAFPPAGSVALISILHQQLPIASRGSESTLLHSFPQAT